jgi:hypothetical protein
MNTLADEGFMEDAGIGKTHRRFLTDLAGATKGKVCVLRVVQMRLLTLRCQHHYPLNVDTKLLGDRLKNKIASLHSLCSANEESWKDDVIKPLFKESLNEFFSYPYVSLGGGRGHYYVGVPCSPPPALI